eukprot:3628728-Amphidinium_carterae.1
MGARKAQRIEEEECSAVVVAFYLVQVCHGEDLVYPISFAELKGFDANANIQVDQRTSFGIGAQVATEQEIAQSGP